MSYTPPSVSTLNYEKNIKVKFQNKLVYGYKMDLLTLIKFLSNIVIPLDKLYLVQDLENIINKCQLDQEFLDDSCVLLSLQIDVPFRFEIIENGVIIYPYDVSLYFHSNPNQYYMREFNINLIYSDIDINEYTSRLKMEYTREFIYFLENNGYDFIANNLRWHLVSKIFVD